MKKDQYGMWTITIPAKDGQPAIPHNSKIKVWISIKT
jgi:1,4-alpha-glucan branching enzyme